MMPLKSGGTHLKVQLYYNKGGMNYFTGRSEARGVYLSVTPVSVSKGEGYSSESCTAFSGFKKLLFECARFNAKQFESYVPAQADIDELVNGVLAENGIELVKEE
jgi:hypothetical protein